MNLTDGHPATAVADRPRADLRQQWEDYRVSRDTSLRGSLILHCMPLVRYVVSRFVSGMPAALDRDDLVGSGVYGLIDAIERYDPDRNMKFETYAIMRIRSAVVDELRAHSFNPRTVRRRLKRAQEIREALRRRYRGTPAQERLEGLLGGTTADDLRLVSFVSLHSPASGTGADEGSRIQDELQDVQAPSVHELAELNEAADALHSAVAELPEYERDVITRHYFDGMKIKDISRVYQVTEARISQVHSRALRRLRTRLKSFI